MRQERQAGVGREGSLSLREGGFILSPEGFKDTLHTASSGKA